MKGWRKRGNKRRREENKGERLEAKIIEKKIYRGERNDIKENRRQTGGERGRNATR